MFCASCGNEIPAGAKFCKGCGAPVGTAAQPTSADAFRQALREQAAEDEARRRRGEAIAAVKSEIACCREELKRVKNTLRVSPLIGLIVSLMTVPSMFSSNNQRYMENMMYDKVVSDAQIVLCTIFCGFLFAIVVFGLAFIRDKMAASGYWVFGGWVVLLALFFLVLMVATFVGLPYAFVLMGKKSRLKKQLRAAEEQLAALEGRGIEASGRSAQFACA